MMVRTLEVVDEIVDDDGSIVLLAAGGGHRVVRLSALGQAVRELADGGTPFEQLVSALTERFGAPPEPVDVGEALRAALATLESEGVVRVDP